MKKGFSLEFINCTVCGLYDGAEVVKGQTGKMTFKKDIKVYKRNPNGTFDSLVVKRNNFFRTYDIEKYDGKVFYQMGQYRVQATDLVAFKEVPIKIRSSFYQNPTYIKLIVTVFTVRVNMVTDGTADRTFSGIVISGIQTMDNCSGPVMPVTTALMKGAFNILVQILKSLREYQAKDLYVMS